MAAADNNYPVVAEHDGIKLKTENMGIDKLYHCIYDNKVFYSTKTINLCCIAMRYRTLTQ